jgi:hypothetical protein
VYLGGLPYIQYYQTHHHTTYNTFQTETSLMRIREGERKYETIINSTATYSILYYTYVVKTYNIIYTM